MKMSKKVRTNLPLMAVLVATLLISFALPGASAARREINGLVNANILLRGGDVIPNQSQKRCRGGPCSYNKDCYDGCVCVPPVFGWCRGVIDSIS
jgi:hypothetical protein